MIVLDENVFESQRIRLRRWGIHLNQIGRDVGRKGMQDHEIITLLRTLRRPTFVSRDSHFFHKTFCNERYSLVYLDVRPLEVAEYVRRVLRHPEFKTWSLRKGRVLRVAPKGISAWYVRVARLSRYDWMDQS